MQQFLFGLNKLKATWGTGTELKVFFLFPVMDITAMWFLLSIPQLKHSKLLSKGCKSEMNSPEGLQILTPDSF